MKPFSLDVVLDYRKRLEDQAMNKLFEARKEKETIEEKITLKELMYQGFLNNRDDIQQDGCPILDLITVEAKIDFTDKQLQELKTLLSQKEASVQRAHQNLLTRSKEKQVLEKLKDKQNREWQKYLNKKEAAMLDEIAILRHNK